MKKRSGPRAAYDRKALGCRRLAGATSRKAREVAHPQLFLFSAEETDLRIPGNHCACHYYYDNHNSEFHVVPTPRGLRHLNTAGPRLRRFTGKTRVRKWGCCAREWEQSREYECPEQSQQGIATSVSENTSAVKASMLAPLRQASSGKPALRQVCSKNVSRSQSFSVGT